MDISQLDKKNCWFSPHKSHAIIHGKTFLSLQTKEWENFKNVTHNFLHDDDGPSGFTEKFLFISKDEKKCRQHLAQCTRKRKEKWMKRSSWTTCCIVLLFFCGGASSPPSRSIAILISSAFSSFLRAYLNVNTFSP